MAPVAPGLELLLRRIFFALALMLVAAAPRVGAAVTDPPADERPPVLAQSLPLARADADAPRSGALVPLYVSLAALQVVDIHSTSRALSAGGREGNPIAGAFVGSQTSFTLMKIASTAGVVVLTERLRKQHPAAAMLLMIGLDSAYAGIAAHNYGIRTADAVR